MTYEVWIRRTTDKVWVGEAENREEAVENAMFADGVLLSAQETKRRVERTQKGDMWIEDTEHPAVKPAILRRIGP